MNSWQSSAFFWSLSLGLRLHRVSLGYMGLILSSRPSIAHYFQLFHTWFTLLIRSNYVLYLYHRCHKVYVFIELCTLCYKNKRTSDHFFLPAVMLSTTRSSSSKLWLAIVLLFVSILPAYDIRTLERGRLLPRT